MNQKILLFLIGCISVFFWGCASSDPDSSLVEAAQSLDGILGRPLCRSEVEAQAEQRIVAHVLCKTTDALDQPLPLTQTQAWIILVGNLDILDPAVLFEELPKLKELILQIRLEPETPTLERQPWVVLRLQRSVVPHIYEVRQLLMRYLLGRQQTAPDRMTDLARTFIELVEHKVKKSVIVSVKWTDSDLHQTVLTSQDVLEPLEPMTPLTPKPRPEDLTQKTQQKNTETELQAAQQKPAPIPQNPPQWFAQEPQKPDPAEATRWPQNAQWPKKDPEAPKIELQWPQNAQLPSTKETPAPDPVTPVLPLPPEPAAPDASIQDPVMPPFPEPYQPPEDPAEPDPVEVIDTPPEISPQDQKDVQDQADSDVQPPQPPENADPALPEVLPIKRIVASSTQGSFTGKTGLKYNFDPQNLADGDLKSSWQTKGSGPAWLDIEFESPVQIVAFEIANGFQWNNAEYGDLFTQNARVKQLTITAENAPKQVFNIEDSRGWQTFDLSLNTSKLRITVSQSTAGSRWKDIALSEIRFIGRSIP